MDDQQQARKPGFFRREVSSLVRKPFYGVGSALSAPFRFFRIAIQAAHESAGFQETFAEAVDRLDLTEADVRATYSALRKRIFSLVPILLIALLAVITIPHALPRVSGALVSAAVLLAMFASAFRCWQIRHKAFRGPKEFFHSPGEWWPPRLSENWRLH